MKLCMLAMASVMTFTLVAPAKAADSPAGTWKWTNTYNNNTRETTLTLKLDGDKLSGTITGRENKEIAIEDAKYADGEVSFSVSMEGRNGNKFTRKYSGKLSGDTIKGKVEFDRNGQSQSRDWEAKRS